jgi:hypothetical protein
MDIVWVTLIILNFVYYHDDVAYDVEETIFGY